jgi:hypothetical protein
MEWNLGINHMSLIPFHLSILMSTLDYLYKLFFTHAGTFFLPSLSVPAIYDLCFFFPIYLKKLCQLWRIVETVGKMCKV